MSELVSLSKDGEVAIITVNNPPVNALSPGVPEGIASAVEAISKDPERQSRSADRRRKHLHCRSRHKRVRQGDVGGEKRREPVAAAHCDRRLPEAYDRRDSRDGVWRRVGSCDGLSLSRRRSGGSGGPAGSEARHHPGRGGHAAASATGGRSRRPWRCAHSASLFEQPRRLSTGSST